MPKMKPHRALACLCLCAWIIPGAESLAVQKCTTLCAQPPSQKLRAGEGPGPATATAQGSARWVAGIPELALGDVRSIVSELHAQMLHTKDQLLAASVPEMEHILDRVKVTFGAKIAFRDALIELQQNITRDAERDRRLGKDPSELIHWLHPPPSKEGSLGGGGALAPLIELFGAAPKEAVLADQRTRRAAAAFLAKHGVTSPRLLVTCLPELQCGCEYERLPYGARLRIEEKEREWERAYASRVARLLRRAVRARAVALAAWRHRPLWILHGMAYSFMVGGARRVLGVGGVVLKGLSIGGRVSGVFSGVKELVSVPKA